MNEQRYLIEILLRARDQASQLFQKVADQLKKVEKAQDNVSDSTRRANAVVEQQRGALEQLHQARIREKKGLDDSAAALRAQSSAARQNADTLRNQAAQVRASADALRAQRDATVKAQQASLAEASSLRDLARARADQVGAIDKTAQQLTRQAEAARREADQNRRLASSYDQSIRAIDRRANALERDAITSDRSARAADRMATSHERSSSTVARSISTITRQLAGLDSRTRTTEAATSRFGRTLQRLGIQADGTKSNLRGLNAEFQGFQLAIVIKYAQSLLSTLIALGAQLVSVAAAAGQAAAGLGAAFGAAAAQAIPVVGVLAAAFGRLTAVLKAVKLQNQQQLAVTHNTATEARRQTAAADQIRNAQQQVADAHRNVARAVQNLAQVQSDSAREQIRAQNDVVRAQQNAARNLTSAQQSVTQARKDAIRTVEDLVAAERDAQVQLLQAQAQLRGSVQSGDVLGTLAAFDAQAAARRGVTRARQDAAPVRARGVEGVPAVQQAEQQLSDTRVQGRQQVTDAEQRLADVRRTSSRAIASAEQQVSDAQRQSRRSEQDLARTRVQATQNIAQETAATDKLTNSIKLLSPAERQLYRRILALQETYKRAVRPITDIITRAFTGVVDRVNALLHNPQIMRGFRNIAVEIASSIRRATSEAGGPRSISVFELLQREAARNIPIVTRIAVNFFRTIRSLVVDALPSFRLLLHYVDGYAGALRRAVETRPGQLRDFFVQGVRYANQFFKLGLAVVRLLLAIGGRGGAAGEGIRTINELTGYVDHLTNRVDHNAGAIRRFFASTHDSVKAVLGVLGTLAVTLFKAFNPQSIKTLADFLNAVIIPALGTTIQVMGVLVNAFHQILTLPGVAQLAEIAATFLLMAKGLDIIHHAISSVIQILPNFLRGMGLMAAEGAATEGTFLGLGIAMGGWVLIIGGAVVAAIVLLNKHFHFLGPTFKWLKGAAKDTFDWLKTAARSVVRWFEDVWNHGLLKWIRNPFVFTALFPGFAMMVLIIRHARTVVDFFKGAWQAIERVVAGPFERLKTRLEIVWGVIETIVVVALDLIAGRFNRIGPHLSGIWSGIWSDIKKTLIDSVNAMIDAINTLIDGVNKISPLGDIGHIGRISDDTEKKVSDATSKIADHYDKVGNKASDNADRVKSSMEEIEKATSKAAKNSARSFDQLFKAAHVSLQDISDVVRLNSEHIVSTLGKNSKAGKEALADNFRQAAAAVKRQMDAGEVSTKNGMRAIRGYLADELQVYGLSIRQARTLAAARARGDTATSFSGGPEEGTRGPGSSTFRAGGGMVSSYGGWPRDDHVVVDPYGRVTARVSGNEGIVNPPQMDRINYWGSIAKGLGLDSYGSLQDMWGMRGGGQLRRFASGGGLHPAVARLSSQLDRMFGLQTTSGFRTTMPLGHPDYHNLGLAADVSGTPAAMARATNYIMRSGIWRNLLEGIHNPGLSIKNGQHVPPGFWGDQWAQHINHIHIALRSLAGIRATVGAGTGQIPRIPIVGGGAVGRVAQRALNLARISAQHLVNRAAGATTTREGSYPVAQSSDANVVAAFRRAMRDMRANRTERLAGWEAGIVESGLRNLPYGDLDSLGSLQERASIFGRAHALNPYASMVRFLRDAISRRPWRGSPGALAQAVQRSAFPGRYDAVVGRATRYLQTGGPLKGIARPARVGTAAPLAANLTRALNPINTLMDGVSSALEAVARGPLRRSQHLAHRITAAFDKLTGPDGLLDLMAAAVDAISARATAALQRRQFRVGRGDPRRIYQSPADAAQAQLQTLQSTRTGLVDEQTAIQSNLTDAQRALAIAQRRHNARAVAVARAAIDGLRQRQAKVAQDLAQNAQDQVEAQESFQQALLDSVTAAADQQNNAIDRWSRVAKALGQTIDPNVVLRAQIANMRRQIDGLQGVLARAMHTGNLDLARTVRDQINDLNTQIAEAVAQQFQNAIDAVNNQAQSQMARLDRATRRAQLGGQTDFAALQGILTQRQDVMATQRAGLQALIDRAFARGNVDQFNNLADQIDELDTAMAENTQAIKDNSDAAFNLTTQMVNDRASFATGIFSSAQGFFQALTQATGLDTSAQQLAALQATNATLADQQSGLRDQIAKLLDFTPDWQQWLRNLSGADLVGYLSSLVASPTFSAYLDTLDPTQQQSFRDLISSLIGNATAVEQNTQAITDLTGATTQSFASSFWTAFRTAVFTGEGQLLPQYAMTIPSADVGARVMQSGALMVHAGETVRPAAVNRDWRAGEGDTYNLNLTSPTEVLDPVDVNRQLAFLRRTSGR